MNKARFALAGVFLFALVHSAQQTRKATLEVTVIDAATGEATPARVRIEDSVGTRPRVTGAVTVSETAIPIPKEAVAVMWGRHDRAEGFALQPDGSFYVDGMFRIEVPAGEYTLTVSKGSEYLAEKQTLNLVAGASDKREVRLERWINMPDRGWYSADDHVHLQRSPRENPLIAKWMQAEDVHVANILEMGDFWATFFSQYSFGDRGRYREGDTIVSSGQEEPRTPEIGHTISLGADELVRFRNDYYNYGRLFDRVHELNGVSGFAHQGVSFHGYRGMTLNVLRGKLDFLELAQFCVAEGPLALTHYYHFLDMGFRLTALAGSDFPWCGRGPKDGAPVRFSQIGDARFYTYVGGELTFDGWLDAVKAGRTFASTGPAILLRVNGKLPGETIDVKPGTRLTIQAEAFGHSGQVPLRTLEIVGHGEVLQKATGEGAAKLEVALDLPVDHGIWIAARCEAGQGQVAHTTPVYVTVNGDGFHNPKTARERLQLSESYLKELEQALETPEQGLDRQLFRHKERIESQIAEARAVLKRLDGSLRR